jgi:hypothetical protein
MWLIKVGALVVWRGQVVPIVNRYVDKEGAQYHIHTKARDGALVQDVHVTLGQLLGALNDHATHCVGDKVALKPFRPLHKGTVVELYTGRGAVPGKRHIGQWAQTRNSTDGTGAAVGGRGGGVMSVPSSGIALPPNALQGWQLVPR